MDLIKSSNALLTETLYIYLNGTLEITFFKSLSKQLKHSDLLDSSLLITFRMSLVCISSVSANKLALFLWTYKTCNSFHFRADVVICEKVDKMGKRLV